MRSDLSLSLCVCLFFFRSFDFAPPAALSLPPLSACRFNHLLQYTCFIGRFPSYRLAHHNSRETHTECRDRTESERVSERPNSKHILYGCVFISRLKTYQELLTTYLLLLTCLLCPCSQSFSPSIWLFCAEISNSVRLSAPNVYALSLGCYTFNKLYRSVDSLCAARSEVCVMSHILCSSLCQGDFCCQDRGF